MQIDSLYISNIENYMRGSEDKGSFLKTIRVLSESDTFVVDAHFLNDSPGGTELHQRVILPRMLQDSSSETQWWCKERGEVYFERESEEEQLFPNQGYLSVGLFGSRERKAQKPHHPDSHDGVSCGLVD